MKFIKKSLLILSAALITAGPINAYPVEATKLVNEKTKETIYNIKDCHKNEPKTKNQTDLIVRMAQDLKALVIVENAQENRNIQASTGKKGSRNYTFLPELHKKCKTFKISVKNAEKRLNFRDFTRYFQNHTIDNGIQSCVKYINDLHKSFLSKSEKTKHGSVPQNFYKDELKKIKSYLDKLPNRIKQLKQKNLTKNKFIKFFFGIISMIDFSFLDIEIINQIGEGRKKKYKNFIICSGLLHGNAIEVPLTKMGFTKETIVGSCKESDENPETIDLKKLFDAENVDEKKLLPLTSRWTYITKALKIGAVAVVMGAIIGYSLYELLNKYRKNNKMKVVKKITLGNLADKSMLKFSLNGVS